jgi:hypothetical protein
MPKSTKMTHDRHRTWSCSWYEARGPYVTDVTHFVLTEIQLQPAHDGPLLLKFVERIISSLFGRRAAVVGGGIGGLSAAGALAGYFEQLDVLERDRLAASAEPRSGTPQDRHTHTVC